MTRTVARYKHRDIETLRPVLGQRFGNLRCADLTPVSYHEPSLVYHSGPERARGQWAHEHADAETLHLAIKSFTATDH
jgi:hypothetical protein